MTLRTLASAWVLVWAACASGSENQGDPVDGSLQVDAATADAATTDAPATDAPSIDAAVTDAAVTDAAATDAGTIDAMTTIDAATDAMTIDAGCTTTVLQILTNPAFDATPIGTGWVQTPYDIQYPLITADDGIPEHTAPNKAWMGGIVAPIFSTASDTMYQQVTVPAGTTVLRLRGQYEVRTGETGGTVYDTGAVDLVNTSNGLLQTVMSLSNAAPTAAWTPFNVQFGSPYAGQTVRLRFRTTNDDSFATSFYFDSLFLEATVCQ